MSEVEIKLTKDEALVLFDFVSRFSNDDKLSSLEFDLYIREAAGRTFLA
jgi:hypothetical protein